MTAALKSAGTKAAAVLAIAAIERFMPALAVGLVAMAHELHFDSAARESARRARCS